MGRRRDDHALAMNLDDFVVRFLFFLFGVPCRCWLPFRKPTAASEHGPFAFVEFCPTTGATVRKLATLKPKVLATMHGSSFSGDGATALSALGDHYDLLLRTALADRKLT